MASKTRVAAEWVGVVLLILGIIGGLVWAVFNFIWWQECLAVGGVYVNGEGILPSCFTGAVLP